MGYSYGYGYKKLSLAEKFKEKLEKKGHEVCIEKDKTNHIFYVRDFGIPMPQKLSLWKRFLKKFGL